mmetsp:Transcript_2099/g.4642  ORF Transcript_2099/g.4642 Transcript_2099/m.4642 type:complete len:350 (-) Transcript_2099:754-1803(-)
MLVHHRRVTHGHLTILGSIHPGIWYRLDHGTSIRTLPLFLLLLSLSIPEVNGTALAPPLHREGVGARPRRSAARPAARPDATAAADGRGGGGIERVGLFVVHVGPVLVHVGTDGGTVVIGRRRVLLLLLLLLVLGVSGRGLVRTVSVQRRRTHLGGVRVVLLLLSMLCVFQGIRLRRGVPRRRRGRRRGLIVVVRRVPRRVIQLRGYQRFQMSIQLSIHLSIHLSMMIVVDAMMIPSILRIGRCHERRQRRQRRHRRMLMLHARRTLLSFHGRGGVCQSSREAYRVLLAQWSNRWRSIRDRFDVVIVVRRRRWRQWWVRKWWVRKWWQGRRRVGWRNVEVYLRRCRRGG